MRIWLGISSSIEFTDVFHLHVGFSSFCNGYSSQLTKHKAFSAVEILQVSETTLRYLKVSGRNDIEIMEHMP